MKNSKYLNNTKAFTLVELLVVVAILAIISSFVFSQFGNTQKRSAEKVSIANQQAINRAVQSYLALNNGTGLNYLDACIDATTRLGTPGQFIPTQASSSSPTLAGGIYRGPKYSSVTGGAVDQTFKEKNNGLNESLVNKSTLYYLSATDVASLKRLGLTRAMYFNFSTMGGNGNGIPLTFTGQDTGQGLPPDTEILGNGIAGPGFRMEHVNCFRTPLAVGMPVMAIDPYKGASLYKTFGVELKKADGSAIANEAEAQALAAGKVLLLFGLGSQSSIVGARYGGIDSAPRCESLDYTYYRQYFLVIRMISGRQVASVAEFAGVLDPMGQSVIDARFSNEWGGGNQ